jgi:hypothetical protein
MINTRPRGKSESSAAKPTLAQVRAISQVEYWIAGVLFLLILIFRVVYAAHYRIDSDEPQHLHVVWGWTRGMIPYRDYFDNHSPLFQFLCAPFFAWFGERADIIVPMRLLMIVPFAVSIWAVGRIGARVASPRTGLWAAMFVAVCPRFFFVSTEFRPDDLWACIWLLILLTALGAETNRIRAFVTGLLIGISFCVSMKTTLMLIAILLATALIIALEFRRKIAAKAAGLSSMREANESGAADRSLWFYLKSLGRSPFLRSGVIGLAGALIVPAIVLLFFGLNWSLQEMYYCVIEHNIPLASQNAGGQLGNFLKWLGILVFPVALPVLFYGLSRNRRDRWAWWIFLVTLFYSVTLKAFWPIITDEDFLPSDPLFMGLLAFGVTHIGWCFSPKGSSPIFEHISRFLPPLIAIGGIGLILKSAPLLEDKTKNKISMVATVLRLTDPNDYVLDSKGETIYRRRPTYFVMEGLTGMRMKAGLIKENIIENMITSEAPIATVRRMPAKVAGFVRENYLPISFRLSVLGKFLSSETELFDFDVAIPGSYLFITENGDFSGSLDGVPISGPIYLGAGRYQVRRTAGSGRLALFWARAIEEGFSPFRPPKPDKWTRQD